MARRSGCYADLRKDELYAVFKKGLLGLDQMLVEHRPEVAVPK
jgi:hypothetical protein